VLVAAAAVALRLFDLPRELNVSGIILGKRDAPRHEIHDINVSTCLRGDFSAAHLTGDQSDVLPTDTQKQTVYAYALQKGITSIEDHGLQLARHFVRDIGPGNGRTGRDG
jgi:urate oxidase